MAFPFIEGDTKSEYNRLVTWEPDFKDHTVSTDDLELQQSGSINVVLALSYTNAKNFYLAMATAVFSLNPDSATAAGNFAAAVASYADDLLEEGSPIAAAQKFYEDTEKIYHYALLSAQKEGGHTLESPALLVSLGNLYLDSGKYNEAYACFQAAREINDEYSPAREGLYNTYMALKQYKKALELVEKTAKYPAIISTTAKVGQQKEEEEKKPGMQDNSVDEDALQVKCDSVNTIEVVSVADFLDVIDAEAKDKLNELIEQVQGKMKYTAPDITIISQYNTLMAISLPAGQSALTAFGEGIAQLSEDAYVLSEKVYSQMPSDEKLDRAITEMSKYNITQNTDMETVRKFFSAVAILNPELGVFTVNPYEYANPVDIIVQRYNIDSFVKKFGTYQKYLIVLNNRIQQEVDEIIDKCYEKEQELSTQMEKIISRINPESSDYSAKVHKVHKDFYSRINAQKQVYWYQATGITTTAYQQKIKKYAEQMYNSCMKHVILISDDYIRTYLEEKLQGALLTNLDRFYQQLYTSYSFTTWNKDCGCNIAPLEAERKRLEKERSAYENQQILKNMEAKKRFESGVLDENTEYYKKIIKPYEVKITTPFVQGVVGP